MPRENGPGDNEPRLNYVEILTEAGKKERQLAEEKAEQDRKEERKRKFEIPEEVKPKTSSMLWYGLRNTIFVNEESLAKDKKEKKPEKIIQRTEQLIKKLRLEQSILDTVKRDVEKKIEKETEVSGKEIDREELRKMMHDMSADKMYDYIEQFYLSWLNELEEKKIEPEGDFSVEELRDVAEDLRARLMDEANKS